MKYNIASPRVKEVGRKFYRQEYKSSKTGTPEEAIQYLKDNIPDKPIMYTIFGVPINFSIKELSFNKNGFVCNFGIKEDFIETKDGPAWISLALRTTNVRIEETVTKGRFILDGFAGASHYCSLSFRKSRGNTYQLEEYTHGTLKADNPFTLVEFVIELINAFEADVQDFANKMNKIAGIKESFSSRLSNLVENLR